LYKLDNMEQLRTFILESNFPLAFTHACLEAISLLEAVNINKDFLQRLCAANGLDFATVRNVARTFVEELSKGVTIPPSQKDRLSNLLAMLQAKSGGTLLGKDLLDRMHDAIVFKRELPGIILQKCNSDSTPEDFGRIIDGVMSQKKSGYHGLSPEDLEVWNRVKVYHEFPDGFRWVYAVNEKGNPVGFIPTRITVKTMNHCGNEPSNNSGDEYWELRDADGKAYLTVILNDGLIEEAKSYGNQNNVHIDQILPYVEWFYKSDAVKGVDSERNGGRYRRYDAGYASDKNFTVSLISSKDPSFMQWCQENKPGLIGDTEALIIKYSKMDPRKVTEQYLADPGSFGMNNWTVYLASVGGKEHLPLSEDDIIQKLIMPGKLPLSVFANADISLITPKIQAAYVSRNGLSDLSTFIYIMQNVNQFYMARGIYKFMLANGLDTLANGFLRQLPPRKLKYYTE